MLQQTADAPHSMQVRVVQQGLVGHHEGVWLREQRKRSVKLPVHRLHSHRERGEVALSQHGVACCPEDVLCCCLLTCILETV